MNLDDPNSVIPLVCIPRVSGDEPLFLEAFLHMLAYSPRERG